MDQFFAGLAASTIPVPAHGCVEAPVPAPFPALCSSRLPSRLPPGFRNIFCIFSSKFQYELCRACLTVSQKRFLEASFAIWHILSTSSKQKLHFDAEKLCFLLPISKFGHTKKSSNAGRAIPAPAPGFKVHSRLPGSESATRRC